MTGARLTQRQGWTTAEPHALEDKPPPVSVGGALFLSEGDPLHRAPRAAMRDAREQKRQCCCWQGIHC